MRSRASSTASRGPAISHTDLRLEPSLSRGESVVLHDYSSFEMDPSSILMTTPPTRRRRLPSPPKERESGGSNGSDEASPLQAMPPQVELLQIPVSPASLTAPAPPAALFFRTLRLVVVDDESANTRVMCRHLFKLGVPSGNITCFTNGAQLVTYVKSNPSPPPSCILLDLLMPIMGGLEAMKELQQEGIPLPCPVLAATGNVTSGTSAQSRALGFNGMLGKPFTRGRLKRALLAVLSDSSPFVKL